MSSSSSPVVIDDTTTNTTNNNNNNNTNNTDTSKQTKKRTKSSSSSDTTTTGSDGKKRSKKQKSSSSSNHTSSSSSSSSSSNNNNNDNDNSTLMTNEIRQQVNEHLKNNDAHDFSSLILKPDHNVCPIWVTPDMHIFLETFSPLYSDAYDFLVAIAEPLNRPENLHEYKLTEYSLQAAASIGLGTEHILKILEKLSKIHLSTQTKEFITNCTQSYGKVKLVIQQNKFHVESANRDVILQLLNQPDIAKAAVRPEKGGMPRAEIDPSGKFYIVKRDSKMNEIERFKLQSATNRNVVTSDGNGGVGGSVGVGNGVNGGGISSSASSSSLVSLVNNANNSSSSSEQLKEITKVVKDNNVDVDDDDYDDDDDGDSDELGRATVKQLYSFQIDATNLEDVKRCSKSHGFPMLEEYDFKNDTVNENLAIDLKPTTTIRSYQEKSLSKMFSNGRARSGIIVLPCGAGKTLVGITAACTVKKSTVVLCINQVSVEQWKNQFMLWTTVSSDRIITYTSSDKNPIPKNGPVIVITTYNMITMEKKRGADGQRFMDQMKSREWGLMVLDEVHVAPANTFKRVTHVVKAHCKLGLTATLLREDEKIEDLNYLVGSKLYEANWLDLQRNGYLAKVNCVEVWCPMAPEFYREYLNHNTSNAKKKLLYVMNPNKIRACEYLLRVHEKQGDKILVFSDNVYALEHYAKQLKRPYIFGNTSHQERMDVLERFRQSSEPSKNTVFISQVGDTAIDIPEATVIIQISSMYGSRRQETQRLGRILRPKGIGAANQQAYYYSLISQDTSEMAYSSKRQQFLVDQGYSFRVWDDIYKYYESSTQLTLMKSKQEELQLLAQLLAVDDNDSRVTSTPADMDKRRRNQSSLKGKSGSSGAYDERRTPHPLFRNKNKGRVNKLIL